MKFSSYSSKESWKTNVLDVLRQYYIGAELETK